MTVISLLTKHPKTNLGGPVSVISRYRFKQDPYSNLASWLPNMPSNVLEVLQKCVLLDHEKRPQNVAETRNLFASKPMILLQTDPSLENKALQKALRENGEFKKTIVQLREKLQRVEQISQLELIETRELKIAKHNLQQTKTELQIRLEASEETLKKEQRKANRAIEVIQEERTKVEKEKIRAEKAEKTLQEEKIRTEQERNIAKQERNIAKQERIKTKQAEKALQEEKIRAKEQKTRAEKAEKAFQEQKTRAEKALQEQNKTNKNEKELLDQFIETFQETLKQEEIRSNQTKKALQKASKQEEIRAKKASKQEEIRAKKALEQEEIRANQAKKAFEETLKQEEIRANQAKKAFEEMLKQEEIRANQAKKALQIRLKALEEEKSKQGETSKKPPKGFVLIPAGSFEMGSPETESGRRSDEFLHRVKLTRSFYAQKTPVTQAQWKALMGNNPSYFKGDSLPVEQVNWFEACAYANALSRKEGLPEVYRLIDPKGKPGTKGFSCSGVQVIGGDPYACKGYRLPMEAVWEYAVRGDTKTAYYNGDDPSKLSEIAWYNKNSSNKTHPVAQFEANSRGLYDMSGNVWEWCWDRYGSDYYELLPITDPTEPATDPTGPDTGSNRVLRGGSWYYSASIARSAHRYDYDPGRRHHSIGFRLASSAP